MNQFQLLKTRRFLPLFWTQFLGAFNDNVYKNALVILVMYQSIELYGLNSNQLVILSFAVFILPFFLFSSTAGQVADKYEKSFLIRQVKLYEIVVMTLSIVAFYFENMTMLIILLFLLGVQSAFFGPLKYSILPQHLEENELVGGNGMIEMGTFVAILLGTILGGILAALENGGVIVGFAATGFAFLGWYASQHIPIAAASEPNLEMKWNIITETKHTLSFCSENRDVLIATIANAWFWLAGSIFLSQFPAYTKEVLGGTEHVVTVLLAMFSIGIGVGSVLCEKLSHGHIEVGLVPLGAIGISLFSIDSYFASQALLAAAIPHDSVEVADFIVNSDNWRILLDLTMIGFFGGLYIVPLYVILQQRSNPLHRSRVVAANNIVGASFMVLSSFITLFLLELNFNIPQIFLIVGLATIAVTGILFLQMPEFIHRFLIWLHLKAENS